MKAIRASLKGTPLRNLLRNERCVLIGPAAFIVGVMGQIALLQAGREALGAILLLMAALLAAYAWSGNPALHLSPVTQLSSVKSRGTYRESALRLAGVGAALFLLIGSLVAWFLEPEAIFGWQGVLWLAGICLFVVSCARWQAVSQAMTLPPWSRTEVVTLVGLVSLACITYLVALNDIPWRFHYDEVIAYEEAMRFYKGPQISLFSTTWHETGLPSLWFAISGALIHVGGSGLGSVRLGVALVGVATVVPVYGLSKLMLGRAGATIAAISVATAPVAIHYSRVSIINSTTAFAWAICFYFLLKGVSLGRPSDFAWAGLSAGLSMYTYYGTRLLPYLLLVFLAYLAIFHFKLFKEHLTGVALLPVGFFVGFGPLFAYFVRNPEMWAGRGLSSLNVPLMLPTSWEGSVHIFETLAPLVRLNFLSLSVIPSADHVYWGTFMQPLEVVLLAMGLGMLAWRWRQPGAFLILLWGLGVVFVGGTLIDAGHIPAFVHWTPAFPAFFIVIAVGPRHWLRSLKQSGPQPYRVGLIAVGTGVALLAATNLYYYFVLYPSSVPPSFEAAQGRLLESLGPRQRVLFVGNSWQPFYQTLGEMVAPQVDASDLLNPSRSLPLVPDGRDLVFVFNEDDAQYLPVIQTYYRGGKTGTIRTPGGPIGSTYTVPSDKADDGFGVNLELESVDGYKWSGVVEQAGILPAGITATYPLSATWSGAFFSADDTVRLSLAGEDESSSSIWLQESQISAGSQIYVDRGWVPFSVRVALNSPRKFRILMQQGDQPAQEIANKKLWPLNEGAGLAVTHYGTKPTHRIDPFVGASMLGGRDVLDHELLDRDPNFIGLVTSGDDSNLIRWEGEVYADGGGYRMELRTDGNARLTIDGAEVILKCATPDEASNELVPGGYIAIRGGYPPALKTVELSPGWHQVHIDLEAVAGRTNGLEWAWTRPDGVREIVPLSQLRHEPGVWPDSPQKIVCTK